MKIQLEAKTEGQKEYLECLKNKNKKIIFAEGPAGSGKTFIPSVYAISELLKGAYDRIIISRPLVQSDTETGFLPGSLDEKMEPYMRPIMDVFGQTTNKGELEKLCRDRRIEVAPIGYLRGRTFNNSFIIFDEMQNSDRGQLILALTRFGRYSKMVLTGDSSQSDLGKGQSGFIEIMEKIDGIDEVGVIRLTIEDIVREPIIKKILERL